MGKVRLPLQCASLVPMWHCHGCPGGPGPRLMVATHTKGNWWSQELMPVFRGCTETHKHTQNTDTHRLRHTQTHTQGRGVSPRASGSDPPSAPKILHLPPKRRLK